MLSTPLNKPFILLLFVFFSVRIYSQAYPSLNINFLAKIDPETTVNWYGNNGKYAGCYGWHNPADNREYAILGGTRGNYFIDVTIPSSPVVVDFVPGAAQNSLWRELKTYQHYAYFVSDDANSKLQIADMSFLPDSVHLVYESDSLFTRAHTIFVDGHYLYCGGVTRANGLGNYSLCVLDLSNPAQPVLLRSLNQDYTSPGYVHDMLVRNDTVYASCGNEGLHIFKYDANNNNFTQLAAYTNYVQAGYNHSSDLTADGKTLVFTDEVPANTVVKILDVSDLNNLTLMDTIKSNEGATPHNPYIIGKHAVVSYYQDGVVVFDISDPSNVSVSGYFDTDPAHGVNDNFTDAHIYQGCWGAYPFLPSGILLASDMQNGLFILDPSSAIGIKTKPSQTSVKIFPNPSQDNLNILINSNSEDNLDIRLVDVCGRTIKMVTEKIHTSLNKINLNLSDVAVGCYILKINGLSLQQTEKINVSR